MNKTFVPVFRAEQGRDITLKLSPHYLHDMPTFRSDQVVFGKEEDGLNWEYSDRLWGWDWDKAKAAWQKSIDECHTKGSADQVESFLSLYFGKPVDLVCVISGVNRGNGYPYNVYGFKYGALDEGEASNGQA